MNPEQLKEMNEITWWHTMELDGVMTKGMDNSLEKLGRIKLPANLKGKTVIDVGAWDGFFSFECEKRGAKVIAIDTVSWTKDNIFSHIDKNITPTGKKGFNFAHKILNSKVKSEEIEVMNLAPGLVPDDFDLVLCLGILYHMKNPFGMCKVMYDICKEGGLLILESHIDGMDKHDPAMAFYPGKECNNDPGTWFGPNPPCIEAMLKAVGFKEIQKVHQVNNRVVFHARK